MGKGLQMDEAGLARLYRNMGKSVPVLAPKTEVKGKKPKMTKTEAEYALIFLREKKHKFHGLTFWLEAGHKYTPDWYIPDEKTVVEVKGSYRFHSQRSSKFGFDQARIEYPEFKFVWATKQRNGEWIIR